MAAEREPTYNEPIMDQKICGEFGSGGADGDFFAKPLISIELPDWGSRWPRELPVLTALLPFTLRKLFESSPLGQEGGGIKIVDPAQLHFFGTLISGMAGVVLGEHKADEQGLTLEDEPKYKYGQGSNEPRGEWTDWEERDNYVRGERVKIIPPNFARGALIYWELVGGIVFFPWQEVVKIQQNPEIFSQLLQSAGFVAPLAVSLYFFAGALRTGSRLGRTPFHPHLLPLTV